MNQKDPLIIITGPTAAGKTELSVMLAKQINGEIISADSMQIYRGMDIGTAKITPEEMKGIKHYLIDELDPEEPFHVYAFQKRAAACIQNILKAGRIPILVGGTGFYIQAVLYDVEFNDSHQDEDYRHFLEQEAKEKGNLYLHALLASVDPAAAEQIHANNIKRVIRALEFYHETGTRISEHNDLQKEKESIYNHAYFVLNRARSVLYDRINLRVDRMLEEGLVEEVAALLERGVPEDALSMQGIGYKEIIAYLNHGMPYEQAVSLLKQNTRHFAKRQITWFKREKDTIWLNYEDFADTAQMLQKMLEILKEKKIVPLS